MIRLLLSLYLVAQGAFAADVARDVGQAEAVIEEAYALVVDAKTSRDRVRALTRAIHAYEAGLTALRGHIRTAALQERTLSKELAADEQDMARLLAALARIEAAPKAPGRGPDGPLAAARAGLLVAHVVPAIEARISAFRADLDTLSALQAAQASARLALQNGLDQAQVARAELSNAIAQQSTPSRQTVSDTATLEALAEGATSLGRFADLLASKSGLPADVAFPAEKGRLPLPARGHVVARGPEGITLATAAAALVTAPYAATVRYAGPLNDYGIVTILEPEAGYLMILSGLSELFVGAGEVLATEAPIGLMRRPFDATGDKLIDLTSSSGQDRPERLYIELRHGTTTLDPEAWFDLP